MTSKLREYLRRERNLRVRRIKRADSQICQQTQARMVQLAKEA